MPWTYSSVILLCLADPKVAEQNIYTKFSKGNSFQATRYLLIMEGTEKSESSYYILSYWDRLPSYSPCCGYVKSR